MNKKEVETLLRLAFRAGFQSSGEGWNGEYPRRNIYDTKTFRESEDAAVHCLLPQRGKKP